MHARWSRWSSVASSITSLLATLWWAPSLSAQERPSLSFVPVAAGEVRVDGSLRDWRSVTMQRVGRAANGAMRYAVGYDDSGFYVAAQVDDDRLVRTRAGGRLDDAVVLTIASPGDRGWVTSEVWLHPGVPGAAPGLVLVGPPGGRLQPARAARVVEAPRDSGGYDLEAFIPFAAIPGARDWTRGRAAIRLNDVDQETGRRTATVVATAELGEGGAAALPRVTGDGGELGSFASFLRDRRISAEQVQFDLRGDIYGDGRQERVVIAAGQAAAMGAGYRDGQSYDFAGLGELTGRGVLEAELRDLTGDRKADLLVTTEVRGPEGIRTVASVYVFHRGRIEHVWSVVTGLRQRGGHVVGRLEVQEDRRGAVQLRVHAGTSEGLGPEGFRFVEGDEEPLLVPWGPFTTRTYQFQGDEFVKVGETPNPEYRDPAAQSPARAERGGASRDSASAPARPAPVAASAPTAEQRIEAVRRALGVPASVQARFQRQANVAEDPTPEEVLVLGRALVVVGPCFRGGQSYFQFEIPAPNPEDLLDVFTADVTGDGRDEVFLRVRQALGEGYEREVLLVHRFVRGGGFPRALAVEVARTDGTRRVENRVRVVGRGRGAQLAVEPGRANGWNASSWPFGGPANDGLAPLLLPWRDPTVRYHLDDATLVPR